ncbi:unnamed protein product [Effrenium voratum]|nr:unnamed protein product [Effrenium voratum]
MCKEKSAVHPWLTTTPMAQDQAEELFMEPWGVPHKRIGGHRLAPFMKARAIAQMASTWPSRDGNRYFILPQGLTYFDAKGIEALIAVAENRTMDSWTEENIHDVRTPLPLPMRVAKRVLEMRATQPEMEFPSTGPQGHTCYLSKLPPELHPAAVGLETPLALLDERVAVLCADPRYLIMKQQYMLPVLKAILAGEKPELTFESNDRSFLPSAAQHSEDLQNMVAWAKLEYRRPQQVKLFFMEDFVLEPETAFRGLAKFLGLPLSSDVLPALLQRMPQLEMRGLFGPGGNERQHMEEQAKQFEVALAGFSNDLQAGWQDQVQQLLHSPNPRLSVMGRLLLDHQRWDLPRWWVAHSAQLCRPCTFAPRGLCRNAALCSFCHADEHGTKAANRPSKRLSHT